MYQNVCLTNSLTILNNSFGTIYAYSNSTKVLLDRRLMKIHIILLLTTFY